MRILLLFFSLLSAAGFSQNISSVQQKALNNYMQYADRSVEEMSSIVVSVIKYYPTIEQHRKNNSSMRPRYGCPVQLEEYYYETSVSESKALGASATSLNQKLDALKEKAEQIESHCRALDTYHKLEDYKQDNFVKAEELVNSLPALLKIYHSAQQELIEEVHSVYQKLTSHSAPFTYHQAIVNMRQRMEHEKSFLDLRTYNLRENVPTGWPAEQLASSILTTDKFVKDASQNKLSIKYPASSMYNSFNEGVASILESKRTAMDGYNAEAKKSDKHANDTYLGLINYYNGVLVSFYNSFIDYAKQDGFYGLKTVRYLPSIEIRSDAARDDFKIEPFRDVPHTNLQVVKQSTPISGEGAVALSNYVDFINECLRQAKFLQMAVSNFSTSAAYYKGLSTFEGRGGLHYDYKNYKVPLSLFQKTISESEALLPTYRSNLNSQTEVVLNIMKEIEQLSVELERETTEKRYEKDHLEHIDKIVERYKFLFEVLDDRKEILYNDVRLIYDSYPLKSPDANWIASWKALRRLVDRDHEALFQAKNFYKEKTTLAPRTVAIDEQLREVIAKEYDNMKGIEKLGRYNGLCPYTPYEDIPQTSRSLSEKLSKVNNSKPTGNRHPYHDLVYLYNDVIDDFNKFCELSKLGLLKSIYQPEWFEIKDLERQTVATDGDHQTNNNTTIHTQHPTVSSTDKPTSPSSQGGVKIIRDTVYIEKHDTIYLTDPGEDLRSMEGYATNNMVLLLDVSGSMNTKDKLPLLKTSVLNLLSMMRSEDEVSIVVYSGKAKVLLPPTSFEEEAKIRKAINGLSSSGKTDGNAGIKTAYQVVDKNYIRGGNNRIILATDGEFYISDEVFELVEKFSKEDIFISVFNFGMTASSAKNLEKLSAKGKGNYEHITKENMELKLIREAKAKKKIN